MPDLVGQPIDVANAQVAGLAMENTVHSSSVQTKDSSLGTVLSQDPAAGAPLAKFAGVYLQVAALPPPATSAPEAPWSAADQEEAARILADGMKFSIPLAKRLDAGRCAVVQLRAYYATLNDFKEHSTMGGGDSPSTHALFRDLRIVGNCEISIGI